jgi:hypothetical protein
LRAGLGSTFSDIDIGKGTRPWVSSGKQSSGPRETFWNIRRGDGSGVETPPIFRKRGPIAPQVVLVGATFDQMTPTEWIEAAIPARLFPPELYGAQVGRRRDGENPAPPTGLMGRVVEPGEDVDGAVPAD